MGYCYYCESEWVGYLMGGYFCEECERLRKVVKALSARKINEKIKFKMEVFEENKKENGEEDIDTTNNKRYQTRSKSKITYLAT